MYGTDLACEKFGWLVVEFLEKLTDLFRNFFNVNDNVRMSWWHSEEILSNHFEIMEGNDVKNHPPLQHCGLNSGNLTENSWMESAFQAQSPIFFS